MKKLKIFYWVLTVIFAGLMIFSAVPDVMMSPEAVAFMVDLLGYPAYLLPFLGVAKILGAIFIIFTRFPRLTEWAYAGLFIDLAGAIYSLLAVGTPVTQLWGMLMFVVPGIVSYVLYLKVRAKPLV